MSKINFGFEKIHEGEKENRREHESNIKAYDNMGSRNDVETHTHTHTDTHIPKYIWARM